MSQFDAMQYQAQQNAKKAANKEMVVGGLWLGVGAITAGVVYGMADATAGFILFLGALGYGGFRFLRGIRQRWKRRKL